MLRFFCLPTQNETVITLFLSPSRWSYDAKQVFRRERLWLSSAAYYGKRQLVFLFFIMPDVELTVLVCHPARFQQLTTAYVDKFFEPSTEETPDICPTY